MKGQLYLASRILDHRLTAIFISLKQQIKYTDTVEKTSLLIKRELVSRRDVDHCERRWAELSIIRNQMTVSRAVFFPLMQCLSGTLDAVMMRYVDVGVQWKRRCQLWERPLLDGLSWYHANTVYGPNSPRINIVVSSGPMATVLTRHPSNPCTPIDKIIPLLARSRACNDVLNLYMHQYNPTGHAPCCLMTWRCMWMIWLRISIRFYHFLRTKS